MLCINRWKLRGKLQLLEVVTICDHLCFLILCKAKDKILWKALGIAFDRLVQTLGLHTIEFGQVSIENYTLAAQGQDQWFNWLWFVHV